MLCVAGDDPLRPAKANPMEIEICQMRADVVEHTENGAANPVVSWRSAPSDHRVKQPSAMRAEAPLFDPPLHRMNGLTKCASLRSRSWGIVDEAEVLDRDLSQPLNSRDLAQPGRCPRGCDRHEGLRLKPHSLNGTVNLTELRLFAGVFSFAPAGLSY
jgi:hypothetical protein